MKRKIGLRLITYVLCIGFIGLSGLDRVEARPNVPTGVNIACGSDPSLVGCWLFDEGSGNLAHDGAGFDNVGTLAGYVNDTIWVPDRFGATGKALYLNGTSQYVRVADENSLDITGDISIAAWVKPAAVRAQGVVMKAVVTGSAVDGYELFMTDLTGGCTANPCALGRFNFLTSGDIFRIEASSTYTVTNPWTLYVITYEGGTTNTLSLYRDGELSTSRVLTSALSIAPNNLYLGIGAQLSGTGPKADHLFKGALDEIRLYNRALTPDEVAALYDLPSAINITGLNAVSTSQGIQISWQSVHETGLVGFNVLRSGNYSGPLMKINPQLIPGVNPGQFLGNDYQFMDGTAIPGQQYYYWIEWVGTCTSVPYGPILTWLAPFKVLLPLGVR